MSVANYALRPLYLPKLNLALEGEEQLNNVFTRKDEPVPVLEGPGFGPLSSGDFLS
jgi:hypothetical protein